MSKTTKILIAAGGTGGHLFPAQALAQDLLKKRDDLEVLFVGGALSSNRCFQKDLFAFQEIFAATPYLKANSFIRSLWSICKGVRQSFRILRDFKPDLLIGFGSYHAFPLLVAAFFKRVPIVLFEPDSAPGKVNRFFSRWAKVSAIQFSGAAEFLSGATVEVKMPLWERGGKNNVSQEEARAYFCLDPYKQTLLVFGGSQGASSINRLLCETASLLKDEKNVQIIHFTGQRDIETVRRAYARFGLSACVKEFEDRMHYAWRAANLVICRAGAATLAELVAFEVPGILIPYPFAANDHQKKNARFMQREVGGAVCLEEMELNREKLYREIRNLFGELGKMHEKICLFKSREHKEDFTALINRLINKKR
jgi:UDP-N-acetylglucosamine--N-acetylmuramyl-(pentapeptide) pyrophosphoryl-undecaprenol N-acetylglucosamine transferase